MLKVAITGNIGSGKSTVSKIFQALGIPVFIADVEARLLYKESEVKEEMKRYFPGNIFNDKDELDKKVLADIIFNDANSLKKINKIIHPRTLDKYKNWLEFNLDHPYTIHESAILFENNLQHRFDKTINITAPREVRIKRVMKRDGVSFEDVNARMKNQLSENEKNKLADHIISNDGKSFLIPQVLDLDQLLKSIK